MHQVTPEAIKAENGKCHQAMQVMQLSLQVLCMATTHQQLAHANRLMDDYSKPG